MNQACSLEITDRDGWQKSYPVTRAIVYVGSDPGDDIVLDRMRGGGVTPRHIQLIAPALGGGAYRLVNLGDSDVPVGSPTARAVPPRSFAPLSDGDVLRLGDFSLVFREMQPGRALISASAAQPAACLPAVPAAALAATSSAIGLRLSLPTAQLWPDRPISGAVVVSNLGAKPGVQFRLEVDGLPADCYEIGPGPLLFPGAEKAVPVRLAHSRRPDPRAGPQRVTFRASAPDAYAGEAAVVSQEITVMPYHSHSLRLEG
jgi:hypothetical protein